MLLDEMFSMIPISFHFRTSKTRFYKLPAARFSQENFYFFQKESRDKFEKLHKNSKMSKIFKKLEKNGNCLRFLATLKNDHFFTNVQNKTKLEKMGKN